MWVQDETLQDNLDANGGSSAVVDQTPLSPTAFTYANYGLFDQLAGRHWGAIAPVADHVSNPSYYINSTGTYLNGKVKTIVGYSWNSSSRTDYTFAVPAGSFYQGTAALLPPTKSVAYTQKADIPMASIVIAVTPHINYFVDYSKSYKPQTLYEPTLNLATGAVEGSLGPQTGVGYDSGFKFDYTRTTGISGSIDAYDVTEQNVSQVLNTNIVAALLGQAASLQQRYYVGGTAQRDRGIEVQFFYNPSPSWSVYWNYAYSSAFISQSLEQPSLVGEEANDHSKNDFNLFAKYTYVDGPLKGWFLGPSISARSRYYRIQANEYGYNAGYGVLNGLVGYSGKWGTTHYTVQINVENVFNKIYVRTYALIGEPREFTVSARLSL
jgi:outer membrane receptor for ferric coprogen and ferric-rhodotorulic acid